MYSCHRVWDIEADDYIDLDQPIPDTDPRYAETIAVSRERLRTSGARDRQKQEATV